MTPEELRACITFANGIDPRVQMTAPNAQLWGRTIGHKAALEVTTAIQVYYERPRINGREHPVIDPTSVRRIINEETETATARQRSLEPPLNKAATPEHFRRRNPKKYDQLFAQAGLDHIRDLEARGIKLHSWQENRTSAATRGVAPF